jgi:hypothetical protein
LVNDQLFDLTKRRREEKEMAIRKQPSLLVFFNYLIALVRPDSFVDHSNVFDEIRLFVEAVLAVVAHERSLVQVDGAEVPVQIALGFVLEKQNIFCVNLF